MKKILFLLLLIPHFTKSQERIAIIKDTLLKFPTKSWPHSPVVVRNILLSNGALLHVGSEIKIGKGTLLNGNYNYISRPSNSMEAKLRATTRLKSIRIIKIRKKGNDLYGFKYILIGEENYIIQLEDAVASGEIIAPVPDPRYETQKKEILSK